MTSISGTATTRLPIPFSLSICAVSQRVADRESTTQRKDERARQLAAKRKAQHEVEMLALEWSKIMLERDIFAALDPATDPALAHKIRQAVQNRGIGKVREVEGDEDTKKSKGGGIAEFIEALAAISTAAGVLERTPPSPTARIERDIGSGSTDEDLQQLLDDLNDDIEVDDE